MPARPATFALIALVPSLAAADDDWHFTPKSAEDAVHVQANQIYPTFLAQLRASYLNLDAGGHSLGLMFQTSIPMPFVLIPGIAFDDVYSIVHLDIPFTSVKLPTMSRTTGVGDMQLIDAAIKYWDNIAVGAGVVMLIPSASDELLGTGKFSIGPIAGASAEFGPISPSIRIENLTSVAGSDTRDDINVLEARTSVIYYLPHATYVTVEPRFQFDWEDDGATTVLLTAQAGFGLSKHWVFSIEPIWNAVGSGKNDVSVSVIMAVIGF